MTTNPLTDSGAAAATLISHGGAVTAHPRGDSGLEDAIAAFSEIAAALSAEMELDSLLHLVMDKVCALLGIVRGSLYLKDEKGKFRGQVARYAVNVDAEIKTLTAGVPADAFTLEILEKRRPVLIADARTDPRPVRAQMRRWGVRSILGIPMILGDEIVGIIYLDNGEEPYPYTAAQQGLAQIFVNLAAIAVSQSKAKDRLKGHLEAVRRENDLLRRTSMINHHLTLSVVDGAGVDEIAQALTETTGHPCVVHDVARNRIAEAGNEADKPVISVLDRQFTQDPRLASKLRSLDGKRSQLIGPIRDANLNHRFLVTPILVRDAQWGSLVVQERRSKLDALDMLVSQFVASLIALELVAARRVEESEFDSRRALLTDLVKEGCDTNNLVVRARRLNLDLREPHALIALGTRDDHQERLPSAQKIVEALRLDAQLRCALAAEIDDVVVLAIPLGREKEASRVFGEVKRTVLRALAAVAPSTEVLAGVSSPCCGPEQYARGLFEAAQIVEALRAHWPPSNEPGSVRLLANDDLGSARFLLASHSSRQLNRFLHDSLGRLLDTTQPSMVTLLTTLEAYLESGRSTGRTAAALGVHENTVRYRLARIDELAQLPVSTNSEAQVRAQLALVVLKARREVGE